MVSMRLLREVSKNDFYAIRKSSKNWNMPKEMVKDMQLKLENLGYMQKAKEEAGCKVACTLAGCSWGTSSKPNFNRIKLTEKGINALKRS